MIVLKWLDPQQRPVRRLVAIFGVGLIGHDIYTALKKMHCPQEIALPFSWSVPNQQPGQIDTILDVLVASAVKGENVEVAVVWSAGVAGFTGNDAEFEQEHEGFLTVLGLCRRLNENPTFDSCEFHFLSSAGGLYEGQRRIHDQSSPAPKRPYGLAKLKQEGILKECSDYLKIRIYRPSTVYGFHAGIAREGLVIKLMRNVQNGETTNIYGRLHTLRDYIMSREVGHFIAHKLGRATEANWIESILASGKPTSLMQVVFLVEEIFQRKALVQYSLDANNALDNTFRRDCRPDGWNPTDLAYGVKALALQLHA